jgi:hypothetical protein
MNSNTLGGIDGSVQSVIDRWWDITAIAGASSVTANLTFTYRGSENTTTLSPTGTFAAQHWNGTSWDNQVGSGTGVTSGTGTVSVTGANTFSPWVLSSSAAPLPIELLSFNATLNANLVDLNWATSSETNNSYFTIEKTMNGHDFELVGTTKGAGTSTSVQHYSMIDHAPFQGLSYYRLTQTDYDGRKSYSELIPITVEQNEEASVVVFPNPGSTDESIFVQLNNLKDEETTIVVKDLLGRTIASKSVNISSNSDVIDIKADHAISKGTYIVTIQSSKNNFSKKLVIK